MMQLHRNELQNLLTWFNKNPRKPLIIRGARQVGKSTLVQLLAEQQQLQLVTLDFEKKPELAELFISNEPKRIISLIAAKFAVEINYSRSLLFLDEIQKTPQVLQTLRYFYEELPEMAIICAGSLLDLALANVNFSMPVGRISYMYMGPMRFQEFLLAIGHAPTVEFLQNYKLSDSIPNILHQQLLDLIRLYYIVGGMPGSVKAYAANADLLATTEIKQSLLTTYQDDFAKYATTAQQLRMRQIFNTAPKILGEKFKYCNINRDEKSVAIKEALEKLVLAKLLTKVCLTHANGIPLGAEQDLNFFKTYFLDVGLVCTALDLNYFTLNSYSDLTLINSGKIAEQFIAQHLLYMRNYFEEPKIYYWARQHKSSAAELDFVVAHSGKILPIEVKAGASGTLKSMHQFLYEKNIPIAVRFYSNFPHTSHENIKLSSGKNCNYTLFSLPLYMVEQLYRLIDESV